MWRDHRGFGYRHITIPSTLSNIERISNAAVWIWNVPQRLTVWGRGPQLVELWKVTEISGDFRAELEEVGQRRQASQGSYLGPSFLCFLATKSWRTWFNHILLPCTDSETAQHSPETAEPANHELKPLKPEAKINFMSFKFFSSILSQPQKANTPSEFCWLTGYCVEFMTKGTTL